MIRKRIRLLAALAVLMLLFLPAGIALADPTDSQPPTDTPTPSVASSVDLTATSEPEKFIVNLTSKAKTNVWDDNNAVIGEIAVGEKITKYTAVDAKAQDVVEIVLRPAGNQEDWLREVTTEDGQVSVVSVSISQESTNGLVQGWIEKAAIKNWDELEHKMMFAKFGVTPAPTVTMAQLPEEAAAAPTNALINQNQIEEQQVSGEMNALMKLLQTNLWMLIVFCALCVMGMIVFVWGLQQILFALKRREKGSEQETQVRKEGFERLSKSILANGDTISDLSKISGTLSTTTSEISKDVKQIKKIMEPPPPDPPRWETLIRFANTITQMDRLEQWQDAFRSKSWEVRSIQPIFDLPGYYEIVKFDRARYLAAFILETDEGKNCIVIPSCNDTLVQSSDVSKLFKAAGGVPSNGEYYEILQPAILFSDNDRHYRVQDLGKLIISKN